MSWSIGSLFSGIGGLELGLERAGLGPVLWQAETDPYCRRVLAKHWPEAKRYDDVRAIDGDAERPDIICGGFPCQDISNAGNGAGLAGQRSGLWREFARIVRELRPRVVVVENVSALLGRGFGDVLGDLAACGYDAEWDCIPAAAVGAPHRRDRVFIIAHTRGQGLEGRRQGTPAGHRGCEGDLADAFGRGCQAMHPEVANADGGRRQGCEEILGREPVAGRCGEDVAHANSARQLQQGGIVPDIGRRAGDRGDETRGQWAFEPDVGRVAHGVPDRAHRLRAIGNAVVPQVAEVIGRVIVGMT